MRAVIAIRAPWSANCRAIEPPAPPVIMARLFRQSKSRFCHANARVIAASAYQWHPATDEREVRDDTGSGISVQDDFL